MGTLLKCYSVNVKEILRDGRNVIDGILRDGQNVIDGVLMDGRVGNVIANLDPS